MFAADQYRARAAKYRELFNRPGPLNKPQEFQNLQPAYVTLAGMEDLPRRGGEKIPSRRRMYRDNHAHAAAEEEENILKCLGTAVIMRWNTLPAKLQRELFEHADSIGNLYQADDHTDDEQTMREPLENQPVDRPAFTPHNPAAEVRHAIAAGANTEAVQELPEQTPAANVLDELWRFSCEMPDAPHLNNNRRDSARTRPKAAQKPIGTTKEPNGILIREK
jgi:hypothetical protein